MGIQRTELPFERDFVRIPNAWLRDRRLSRRARGLLAEVMTHSPGWHITINSLRSTGPEGRDAITSAVTELRDAGYLRLVQTRGVRGRWSEVEYALADPTTAPGFSGSGGSTAPGFTGSGPTVSGESAPKKTIPSEDHPEEDHPQELRPELEFGHLSEAQLRHIRDLDIHLNNKVPSPAREAGWSDLTRSEASNLIGEYLHAMGRDDAYTGPQPGEATYEALSPSGKKWADAKMVPQEVLA